jgi:sugar phosphate isomerase/epimerase
MKLGIAGLLPKWEEIDLAAAQRVRTAGFKGASIFFQKPLEADPAKVARLKSILAEAGLEAAQANGWYEVLVHADEALRAEGVRGIQTLCRLGRAIDAGSVYVRPGSHNPRGAWYPHPQNHTAATFDALVGSLKAAARTAEQEGMILALEGHVLSPLDTPQRMRDVLDAVGSPAVKVNMDPVNFIGSVADTHDTTRTLNELFEKLGSDIIAAHLKDCALEDRLVLHIAEVIPGLGTLDYPLLLQRMQALQPQVYALIEHLPDEKVPEARRNVVEIAARCGVPLDY